MTSQSRKVLQWIVAAFVVAAVAVSFYRHMHKQASDRVKEQVFAIVDEMALSPEYRNQLKHLLEAAHEAAFDAAMDPTRKLGRKPDAKVYYEEVFTLALARARESGNDDLATRVDRQWPHFAILCVFRQLQSWSIE